MEKDFYVVQMSRSIPYIVRGLDGVKRVLVQYVNEALATGDPIEFSVRYCVNEICSKEHKEV